MKSTKGLPLLLLVCLAPMAPAGAASDAVKPPTATTERR
jgi:hypothetical protein